MARKSAREAVFLLLYEWELGGNGEDTFDALVTPELDGPITKDDIRYIENVSQGVKQYCEELDEAIDRLAVGWKIERIPRVDLTILRIACYEILHRDDIPDGVAVNEAVDLCGRYSTDEAGPFVNGVLGSLSRGKQKDDIL